MIDAGISTLRDFWEQEYCDDDLALGTQQAYCGALNHWERTAVLDDDNNPTGQTLGDVRLFELRTDHVKMFKRSMDARGVGEQNQQKQWRHLNTLLRKAWEQNLIPVRPVPSIRQVSNILPKRDRKKRRTRERIVSRSELEILYRGCPTRDWRIAVWLLWMFAARTNDAIFMRSEMTDRYGQVLPTIDIENRLLRFEATKTGKLQGLPLTDFSVSVLCTLKSLQDGRLLNLPRKPGSYNRARERWEAGYTTTWRRDICLQNGIEPHQSRDKPLPPEVLSVLPENPIKPIVMKNLRQTAITEFNDIGDGSGRLLGGWVAGHYIPGVTAQNYDVPTKAIRAAFEKREREMMPDCFRELADPNVS